MEKKRQKRDGLNLDFIKKVDLFDAAVPSFNLSGKARIGTIYGGLMSLSMLYLTFLFASTKLVHMFERRNPTVNTYLRKDAFSNEKRLALNDSKFMMAFALEDYFSGDIIDDPRYTKWHASFKTYTDGEITAREVPIFKCRKEDIAKFYTIDNRSSRKVESILSDSAKYLYCIDWEQAQIELFGIEATGNFAHFEIAITPCNQRLILPFIGG